MKLIDDFAKKYGSDKLMHCEGGAVITALGLPFGIIPTIIMFIFMFGISVIKEKYLDSFFDWGDILWACYGGGAIVVYSLIVFLLIL